MRRIVLGFTTCGWLAGSVMAANAQSSIDVLEQELKEAQQTHTDASAQVLSNFFSQVDGAMASPDAAVTLYQNAGGTMPAPAAVVTDYKNETATEKEARLAEDQANLTRLGSILQIHCGLMHFAALFVVQPDQKGLKEAWVDWLKTSAQAYPQLVPPPPDPNPPEGSPPPVHKKRKGLFNPVDIKGKAVRDSVIAKYLSFHAWADKEQGAWSVSDIPHLYRQYILDPLRQTPTQNTLAAWDTYIAMKNVDEPDNDKWNQMVHPALAFDRSSDDYAVAPSTEKIEEMVNLVKANPTHPQIEDWLTRLHAMIADYRAKHGGVPVATGPAPAPAPVAADPRVSVTTKVDGDMTIVTTHTNAAPVNPPAPQ